MARGDGSVERLPSGKFRARVDLGTRADGTRNRPSKTFRTRSEANDWKREQLRLHDAGARADAGTETLGEWLSRWLVRRKAEMAPRGYETYEQHVRLYLAPLAGHILLRDLRAAHVRALDDRLIADGRSAALRHTISLTLRAALNDAVRDKLLAASPAKGLPLPKRPRREFQCWDAAQARAFLKAAEKDRYYALFALALDSGLRLGELLALHWPDLDLDAGTVSVTRSLERRGTALRLKGTKTESSRRRVTVGPQTLAALHAHRRRQERAGFLGRTVFTNTAGDFVHARDLAVKHFRKAIARAGVPRVRFHDLRHICATLLLAAGVNVKAVSARLGHANITITLSVYAHHLPEMEGGAALAIGAAIYGPQESRSAASHGCPTDGQNPPNDKS